MHSVAKFLLDVSGGEEEAFFLLSALVGHVLPHYYAYTAIRDGRASSMHAGTYTALSICVDHIT